MRNYLESQKILELRTFKRTFRTLKEYADFDDRRSIFCIILWPCIYGDSGGSLWIKTDIFEYQVDNGGNHKANIDRQFDRITEFKLLASYEAI